MNVEVLFLPTVAVDLPSKLCVVIDELRATSTLMKMFEAGARQVALAENPASALRIASSLSEDCLICGERGGLPPSGFTHGNSPREFLPGSLAGRDFVFCTSNGTKAMWEVAGASVVLAGSLFNATAVVRAALLEAREKGLDISIVCSGDIQGTKFAIDDAFAAGYMAILLQRESRADGLGEVAWLESATAAVRLYRSYLIELGATGQDLNPPREAILRAFWESLNARELERVGLSADVDYCAQVDISSKVPRLHVEGDRLVLR